MSTCINVFIISLPEAIERRNALLQRLAHLRLDTARVIDAVRGSSLTDSTRDAVYDDDSMRCHAGRSMTPGELGCALSHLRCYEAFLASDAEWTLILEDDAELPDALGGLMTALTRHAAEWHVDAYNLGPVRKFVYSEARWANGYRLVAPIRLWNAHAYLINRQAAAALLALNSPVRFMADDWGMFHIKCGLRIAALDPFPCAQATAFAATGLEQDRRLARRIRLPWGRHRLAFMGLKLARRWVEFRRAFGKQLYGH